MQTSTPDRPRISHMIRNCVRLAGTPENSKRRTTWRSGSALRSTRLRNPHIRRAGSRSEHFTPARESRIPHNRLKLSDLDPALLKWGLRSEEHTSELQSRQYLVCPLLLEKKTDRKRRLPEDDSPHHALSYEAEGHPQHS